MKALPYKQYGFNRTTCKILDELYPDQPILFCVPKDLFILREVFEITNDQWDDLLRLYYTTSRQNIFNFGK